METNFDDKETEDLLVGAKSVIVAEAKIPGYADAQISAKSSMPNVDVGIVLVVLDDVSRMLDTRLCRRLQIAS